MKDRKTFLFHVILPLIVGAGIYYFISPDVIFVKRIDAIIGDSFSFHIFAGDGMAIRLFRNYLPDILWGYALVFALFYVIGNDTAGRWKIFLLAFSFSAVMEILQITPFVQGTFDLFDIMVEFLAEAIAVLIIKNIKTKEEL